MYKEPGMAIFTIDASVFINAFDPYEEGHTTSRQFMRLVHAEAVSALTVPEDPDGSGRGT